MGAQLNIKDDDLVRQAREWAEQDGLGVTATLRAVFERESERRDADRAERLARMDAFTRELQAVVPADLKGMTSREIMDSIYDDDAFDGFAR